MTKPRDFPVGGFRPIHPELSADNFGLTEHEAIFQLQRRLMMK
jgi:hypothetical protein